MDLVLVATGDEPETLSSPLELHVDDDDALGVCKPARMCMGKRNFQPGGRRLALHWSTLPVIIIICHGHPTSQPSA